MLIILGHNTMTFQNISGIIIKGNIYLIKNKSSNTVVGRD